MDAQKAEYWSEEEGFQAMRRSLISYLRTEKDVVSNQLVRFQKFDGDVDTAVSAFEAAEQGNTDELARILASMDPQPTGAPSSPATQAPSQIAGGGNSVVWKCQRRHGVGFRWQRLWCRYESHAERAV